MNPYSEPDDLQLPVPPACPAWCTHPVGHPYESVQPGTGLLWYSRGHTTPIICEVTTSSGERLSLSITAQEYINQDRQTCTEPPRIALWTPDGMIPLEPGSARALADALHTAAKHLGHTP
ncbi:MAG: DUF6907 domain-containing protein [Brooklawnia sp.]|jgi:hypothetical protein